MKLDSRILSETKQLLVALVERLDGSKHDLHKRFDKLENMIMASKQDILDDINTQFAAQATELDGISGEVQALIDKINSGGSVEASDLDDIKAALDTQSTNTKAKLDALQTLAANSPPPPSA